MCKNSFVDFTSKKGFVLAKIVQKTHRQKKLNKKLNQEPRAEKHRQTEK